ncbi:MAG: NAD(P)-dependent oxidoreductase [Armatimonadota bacterium]|nr:NAD(P)-dependent oxidoreductase [Armatimonadota bacterium]MDR7471117.1 NAD(P)-dependent oxidoreductase [Armatimonadota bacterium]MDR7540373.1 NAD(P)-dependent oxidoreductase [Armatimonadota bacterium]
MRVLLVGGTSYVASFFIDECLRRGWNVYTASHNSVRQRILSPRNGDVRSMISLAEAGSIGSVDAIVNFAYPSDLSAAKVHGATRRVIGQIVETARKLSPKILIHLSTQSVFGYAFARIPRPVPVWWATGDGYIETKVLAEVLLLLKTRHSPYARVILRLGNVIGPGSYWMSEVARLLLMEEPVGRGKSNATYVRNIADYLAHVVTAEDGALRAFGVFHHLAELSSLSWADFAEPVAAAMGLQPSYRSVALRPERVSSRGMLTSAFRHLCMFLPDAWQDRVESSYAAVRRRFSRPDTGREELGLHPTLHQTVEFRSHTLPGWSPKFDLQAALKEIVAWVRRAGYVSVA